MQSLNISFMIFCLIELSTIFAIYGDLALAADGPTDNSLHTVRQIPPAGIQIEDELRNELQQGLEQLQSKLVELRQSKVSIVVRYLPDVEIFEKAVRIALTEDGFFEPRDIESAKKLLTTGLSRAEELSRGGQPSWLGANSDKGFTVRGFRSRLDGSVQPYGVAWNRPEGRGDVWCRGRSEKGLELQFMIKHLTNPDPIPVTGVCLVYPFGRYCNANKLAGEVDTFEALEHASTEYPIKADQVAIRGFSMGGAAAWHLAVHYPDKWFAATPGAGFSETPEFLKEFQAETLMPTSYEKTLWQMYDCNKWALNLKNLPTIAYSGALDKQKQAADVMAKACWSLPEKERFLLTHIVAPDTAHKISPEAREEIERRLAVIHSLRKWDKVPASIWFTTYTLKYNRCHWLTVDQLDQHWQQAKVHATLLPLDMRRSHDGAATICIYASGINELTLNFEANQLPADITHLHVNFLDDPNKRDVDSRRVARSSDLTFRATFRLNKQQHDWSQVSPLEPTAEMRKRHELQGPIDDAFTNSFLFVKPGPKGQYPGVDQWVNTEFERAVREWHRQMRGDIRVIAASDLSDIDVKANNIVVWGDPLSNSLLAELMPKLPMKWSSEHLVVGKQQFDARNHLPVLIYPNPLAPNRYIVLNSSFTYREYDYLNNARQVPKLPDWAVIDIRTAPNAKWPGKIVAADFFGEHWEVK